MIDLNFSPLKQSFMNMLGHARFWIIDKLRGTNIVATLNKLSEEQYLDHNTLADLAASNYEQFIEKILPVTPYYTHLGHGRFVICSDKGYYPEEYHSFLFYRLHQKNIHQRYRRLNWRPTRILYNKRSTIVHVGRNTLVMESLGLSIG